MRDVEHIYMNIPRWTGRTIEEGTPWMEAAAEAEAALSQLDSLLGEFGGIGFSSQMGTLASVTAGINAMRNARKYLHEEIVRLVDKPLEECFTRAVEGLAAIDFDKIRVENKAGLVVKDAAGQSTSSQGGNDYSLADVLNGNVPEFNGCIGYNQKINGFREVIEEMGGFTLAKFGNDAPDEEKTKEKKGFWEEIEDSILNFMAYPDWGRANDPTGNPPPKPIEEIISDIGKDIMAFSGDIIKLLEEAQCKDELILDDKLKIQQEINYVFSENSVEKLKKLELADYQLEDIGVYDSENKLIGMMPYYVMINGDSEGVFRDDGGITIGFGHHISAEEWNEKDSEDYLLLKQYVPQNVQMTGIEANTDTIPKSCVLLVPDSQMIPIEVIEDLFNKDVDIHCTKVQEMLEDDKITVSQNEFDALVIYRYNRGKISENAETLLRDGNRSEEDWKNIWTGGENRKEECQKLFFNKEY